MINYANVKKKIMRYATLENFVVFTNFSASIVDMVDK